MRKYVMYLKEQLKKIATQSVFDEETRVSTLFVERADVMWVIDQLYQLDEPEVLSQEWISEHKVARVNNLRKMTMDDVVPVEKLQNLLVPKQEEVDQAYKDGYEKGKEHATKVSKPTIPQFVAEYIQEGHELGVDLGTALTIETDHLNDIKKYIRDNEETFARAWLAYPNIEVEKEPLYRARLKVITDEYIASYLRTQSSDAEDRLKALEIGSKYIHEDYRHLSEFTEDELKRLDIWDSEQWEVEELEE